LKRADLTCGASNGSIKQRFQETEASVTNKLKRGTFPAIWFLAVLAALELDGVALEESRAGGTMPDDLADRIIMFCVIGLVAWAIFGLPAFEWFMYYHPAGQAAAETASGRNQQTYRDWITKDAAGFFTAALAVIAVFQLGMFGVQLWLIRESLVDAKKAAEAAKESADVAKETADTSKVQAETARATLQTMQNTAERQLRAYVFAEAGPLQRGANGVWRYTIHFRNSGQTPAYDVTQYSKADIFDEPVPEDKFVVDRRMDGVNSRAPLPPNQRDPVNTSNTFNVSAAEFADIKAGRKAFYVWGEINFRDAFKINRTVRFRFLHNKDSGPQHLVYAETGNDEVEN
jgi:hypothetical protein